MSDEPMDHQASLDPEPFSLDFLMSLPAEDLTDVDVDKVILYHRNIRAKRATGERTKKHSAQAQPEGVAKFLSASKPKVTLARRGF